MDNFFTEAIDAVVYVLSGITTNTPSVQIQVSEGDPEATKSISIIIDISGSMKGNKMLQAKRAIISSLEKCPDNVEVGLTTFGLKVTVPAGLTYRHDKLKEITNNLTAKGKTPLLKGLQASYENHILQSKTDNGIVLFTDGKPTESSEAEILHYGDRIKKSTEIITVGIGKKVNERFLRKLASSREDYYFAEAPKDIFPTLTTAIGSLVTTK